MLCTKYYICLLEKRHRLQLGSIMYRYSKEESFPDTTEHRPNKYVVKISKMHMSIHKSRKKSGKALSIEV